MVDLSVVVVTYNRSQLLVETVACLRRGLDALQLSYELIIADDCSSPAHQAVIDAIAGATIARTPRNSGLGANTNNGLAHARAGTILQIQDDWRCVDPLPIREALEFLAANPDIGIVQLTPVGSDLPAELRRGRAMAFRVFLNDRLPWMRRCGVRPYSDNPHLKRREFIRDLGPYLEGVPMTRCENEFKRRVAKQGRWRVAQVTATSAFVHEGAVLSLNPGGQRHPLVQLLHRLPGGSTQLEPGLRRAAQWLDHHAARVAVRLIRPWS